MKTMMNILIKLQIAAVSILFFCLETTLAAGEQHWFSGRLEPVEDTRGGAGPVLFDLTISLYNDPQGDDNGNTQDVDPGSVDQDKYEKIVQHAADAVYESTEGAHALRKVRIFRKGENNGTADVVWVESCWPSARLNGITSKSAHINMCDKFNTHDMLADPLGAGYTLAHEWAHYAYGLKDEYKKSGVACTGSSSQGPCETDDPVRPSMMTSQWSARSGGSLVDSRWLNFSIANQSTPAGDFQNTKNNAHHRKYGMSGWQVLATETSFLQQLLGLIVSVRQYYPELAAVAPKGVSSPDFAPAKNTIKPAGSRNSLDIIWMSDDLIFEIVIDRSGSMGGSRIQNAKTAAKLLVDLAKEGSTQIGVISFSSSVTTVAPITPITDQASKNALKAAIDGISSGGSTAIGDAAQAALNALVAAGSAANSKVTFLLSDGQSNSGVPPLSVIPAYQAAQIPILAFSYGAGADTATLGQMASQTKGKLFISPTTLAEISAAFQDANAIASSASPIDSGEGTADPSGGSMPAVLVDSTIADLSMTVTYTGAPADADFQMVAPDNTKHAPASVEQSGPETLVFFNLINAKRGNWLLEGLSLLGDLDFDFQASGRQLGTTYALNVASQYGDALQYPEPMVLTADLGLDRPIAGATLEAEITAPDGSVHMVPLADDGLGVDETLGDGRYAAYFNYDQNGAYDVLVRASANPSSAVLTFNGLELSDTPDGSVHPLPPDVPLTESFSRFSRFQIQVGNLFVDPEGDSRAGAMTIDSENGAVTLGKIDKECDMDPFRIVVPSGASDISVRVSSFLGFDPLLRVFSSHGALLAEGTTQSNLSEGGYLYVNLPATQGETLFAEISDSANCGARGSYAISAGPALPSDKGAVTAKLVNISTRADVGTAHDIAIAGFIIDGSDQKCVVVRGRGPSVSVGGVPLLVDPTLTLYSGQTIIDSNDNWMEQADPNDRIMIEDLGLAPGDFREAAIYICLNQGPFTALLRGLNGNTGVGIVEVFDADDGRSILKNISTRARVGTGPLVTIAGFIIDGVSPRKIMVRGRGPTVGVPAGVTRLSNPSLRLYQLLPDNSNVLLAQNDDWQQAPNAADIASSGEAPGNFNEAAILGMMNPGVYTGILEGQFNSTGSGIIEVLDLTSGGSLPQSCFALTRAHTGAGSNPGASPANSNGCPGGSYQSGTVISLSANPDPGWSVGGWSGTDNDGSTSVSNQVTMPASSHTVTVNYVSGQDQLRITEVGTGEDYIEVRNLTAGTIDLQNFTVPVSGGCGQLEYGINPILLPANEYIQLIGISCWSSGAAGSVGLRDSSPSGVDFVRWGGSGTPPPAGTSWSGNAPSPSNDTRAIGRDAFNTDTDDGSDWCEQDPSPGFGNLGCGFAPGRGDDGSSPRTVRVYEISRGE
jgi:uncharacterized protein YegL